MRTVEKFPWKRTLIVSIIIFLFIFLLSKYVFSSDVMFALLFVFLFLLFSIRDYDSKEYFTELNHKIITYKSLICDGLKISYDEYVKNELCSEHHERKNRNDSVGDCVAWMDKKLKFQSSLKDKNYDIRWLSIDDLCKYYKDYLNYLKKGNLKYEKSIIKSCIESTKKIIDRLEYFSGLDYFTFSELVELKNAFDDGVELFGQYPLLGVIEYHASIFYLRYYSHNLGEDIRKCLKKYYKLKINKESEFEYLFT